eukprot:11889938-Karenia_brevis.AAC.1
MEGHESSWHTQKTGIRQGCPLSPYLFLIVMTCLFEDVHSITNEDRLERAKVSTATFTEVLFADDTICITSTPSAMNDLLACIETVGEMYGLKLNKSKCDLIRFNATSRVVFQDGSRVPLQTEARYL